ncbi:MAG: T9SS type A sorting domain-containing protein [Flavobacteriaceae bacterium]|nr:T9SS type A sorting domain-containing protein [Flavobacteriaceae bacterium]
MNKLKITFFTFLSIIILVVFLKKKKTNNIVDLRKNHQEFIDNHPFQEALKLTKKERKANGIPPNKYFEEEYLLEMNPHTGKTETEKLFTLQEKLRINALQKAVPGADAANAWVERGPRNVPGRTRAVMYDPNDATHKRVFAGGVSGGLWVNDNIESGISSWQLLDVPENLAVSSIIADPNNPQIMYVGTGESYVAGAVNGNGIWKSEDGGTTWSHNFGGSSGITTFVNDAEVTINSGGSGSFVAVQSGTFGPDITTSISGNLAIAIPNDACATITNGASINGNIAVIDRGTCDFTNKILNAQNAGATAVLIVNNTVSSLFAMGGTDASVTIPSVMISSADGQLLKDAIANGTVNITINNIDTDLPAGIVLVPGKYHVNNMLAWNDSGNTVLFAAISESVYSEVLANTLLGGERGLFKSTDDGNTWTQVNLPLTSGGNPFQPNSLLVTADNKIWMSTTSSNSFGDGGGTVFSSIDGNTFTQQYVSSGGRRTEIAASSTDPNKIYLLIETGTVRIEVTNDAFATEPIILPLPVDAGASIPASDFTRGQAFYDLTIAVDPSNDNTVYVGGIDTFRSTDGGSNWDQITKWIIGNGQSATVPFTHADIHGLIFHPTDTDRGLIVSDGGVAYANSFSTANNNAGAIINRFRDNNTTQFYKGSIGQDVSQDQFLGGAQDNGTNFISNATAGTSFSEEVFGGDGMFCFIDKDGDYMILSVPRNSFFRLDLPHTGAGQLIVQENSGTFVNQADLDDNLDILYTNATEGSTVRISRFTDILTASPIRTNLTNALFNRPPTAIKVSPYTTASTTLFVGTDTGGLLKVTNADTTPTWSNIQGSEFFGSISAINFGANEDEIMVTFHNYGIPSIWYTENGGSTWLNKEGSFPDIPVKAILMNPLLNDEVIIGTDLGVWRTGNFKDSSPTWFQSQNGMKNVKVTSFDLRIADNTILASTYGRGFFTGQFTNVPLGISDAELTDVLSIYPTVSNGDFTITSTTISKTNLQVFDMNGRRVYQKELNINGKTNISLSLNKGVYFANFIGDNLRESHKIIIK